MYYKISLYGVPCSGKTHLVTSFCSKYPHFIKCIENTAEIQHYIATYQQKKVADHYQKIHQSFCQQPGDSLIDQGILACYPYNILYDTSIVDPYMYLYDSALRDLRRESDCHISIFLLATLEEHYIQIYERLVVRSQNTPTRKEDAGIWVKDKLKQLNTYYQMLSEILMRNGHRVLICGVNESMADIDKKISYITSGDGK